MNCGITNEITLTGSFLLDQSKIKVNQPFALLPALHSVLLKLHWLQWICGKNQSNKNIYLAYQTRVSFLQTVKDFFSISVCNKHSIVMEFLKLLLSRNNSEKYSKITLT